MGSPHALLCGARAHEAAYERMRLVFIAAHWELHNPMNRLDTVTGIP